MRFNSIIDPRMRTLSCDGESRLAIAEADRRLEVAISNDCLREGDFASRPSGRECRSLRPQDRPKRTESGLIIRRGRVKSSTIMRKQETNWKPRVAADSQRTEGAQQDAAKPCRMMVARDGVEPPTPACSGATGTVLAVTYKDVEGCETPVRTRKREG